MTNAARALDALGDPTRRRIFEIVAECPRSVAEMALLVPVSRPAVSQHLRVLKEAGLVRDEAKGTKRVYSTDRSGLLALRQYFDRFWDGALDRFKAAAERKARDASARSDEKKGK